MTRSESCSSQSSAWVERQNCSRTTHTLKFSRATLPNPSLTQVHQGTSALETRAPDELRMTPHAVIRQKQHSQFVTLGANDQEIMFTHARDETEDIVILTHSMTTGPAHAQHKTNTIEVEKPKIIKMTARRKKPTIQEKISQVIKQVEVPQVECIDKMIDASDLMRRHVPEIQTVKGTHRCSPLTESSTFQP